MKVLILLQIKRDMNHFNQDTFFPILMHPLFSNITNV